MASIFTTTQDVQTKVPFNGNVSTPFYLQFVPGYVVDNIFDGGAYKGYGKEENINSIMAIPHIFDGQPKRRVSLNEDNRYFPLFRGFVDSPAKGDPVLLCTIGGINYYLGPLNTENNPNWNGDNLYMSEPSAPFVSAENSVEKNNTLAKGESLNFKKINLKRLAKRTIPELDGGDAYNETHGDLMLEGRHGNSIRVGSRSINPYIIISNSRSSNLNRFEGLNDGSLISITKDGSLDDHFPSESITFPDGIQQSEDGSPGTQSESTFGFTLSSDLITEPNRLMGTLVSSVNNNQDIQELIYGYNQNQALFQSDRITLNTKLDDIYMSSIKDIHIGTGRHLTISTNKYLIIESDKTYLGNPNKETNKGKMEPMVLGNLLIEILTETLAALKEAQGLCTGAPIPLVDSTMSPLSVKITKIEQKLNSIISNIHKRG